MSSDEALNPLYRILLIPTLGFLLFGLCFDVSKAQNTYVDADLHGSIEIWGGDNQCYQNAAQTEAQITGRWYFVKATWTETLRWWGACDAKIAGSFTNAESGKALDRTRDIKIVGVYKQFELGGRLYRNSVHHIWRHKAEKDDRYQSWPVGNWESAVDACQADKPVIEDLSCPSIGYWSKIGPTFVYNPNWARVQVSWFPLQWKQLTLPPNDAMLEADISLDRWSLGIRVEHSETGNFYYTGQILYSFELIVPGPGEEPIVSTNAISIGVRGGKARYPGWRVDQPLDFISTVIRVN